MSSNNKDLKSRRREARVWFNLWWALNENTVWCTAKDIAEKAFICGFLSNGVKK